MLVCRFVGILFKAAGQPTVIGEIIAGAAARARWHLRALSVAALSLPSQPAAASYAGAPAAARPARCSPTARARCAGRRRREARGGARLRAAPEAALCDAPWRAGILLGPSGLGLPHACPKGYASAQSACDPENATLLLFPTNTPYQNGPSNIRNYLNVCAQLGVVVFMFVVGLEVDVPKLKKTSGVAGIIALISVALPFCLGTFALAPHLLEAHGTVNGKPVPELSFKLFVGTCMSVTAFPVLARIITEKGLQKLQLGSMTLACAALNDVVAWALLAVVLAVQKSQTASEDGTVGEIEYAPVLIELALIVVVVVVQFIVVQPLMRLTVFNHYKRTGSLSPNRLAWVMIGMFLSAWLVHYIGFHSMLGSFTFGLVFPRGYGTPFLYTILSKVEPFATLVLLPLFFMVTGLSIDLTQLNHSGMDLLYILLVASGGKFIGSGVPAKLAGLSWRHTIAIGVMMNTRGLTEIVVLNIAKQAGIIDDEMFTVRFSAARNALLQGVACLDAHCCRRHPQMLVMMAVITTAMAGPLLSLIFPPQQLVLEKALDNAASAVAQGKPDAPDGAQLVVLVHDTARGAKLLSAAVSTLAPNMRAHLDVAQFSPPGELHTQTEMGTGLLRSPEEVNARDTLREQLTGVERRGLTSSITVRTTEDPVADSLMHIRARAPQLVVTDWPQHEDERQRLKELVVASPCTVVLWGGYSPTMAAPTPAFVAPADASASAGGAAAENGSGSAPRPLTTSPAAAGLPTTRPLPKPRPTLRELLRDEAAQDELADELVNRVWSEAARLRKASERWLPAACHYDAAAAAEQREAQREEEAEAHGGGGGAPRVKEDNSVVTPQTMAVAAASSLSPKFSKLMVTGWPENDRECAELVKFLHDVEHEVVAKRLSLEARRSAAERSGSYVGSDHDPMPAIGEEGDVQIIIPDAKGRLGVLLRPPPGGGMSRVASEENLESVTTVGPMLSKALGAALQQQRMAEV